MNPRHVVPIWLTGSHANTQRRPTGYGELHTPARSPDSGIGTPGRESRLSVSPTPGTRVHWIQYSSESCRSVIEATSSSSQTMWKSNATPTRSHSSWPSPSMSSPSATSSRPLPFASSESRSYAVQCTITGLPDDAESMVIDGGLRLSSEKLSVYAHSPYVRCRRPRCLKTVRILTLTPADNGVTPSGPVANRKLLGLSGSRSGRPCGVSTYSNLRTCAAPTSAVDFHTKPCVAPSTLVEKS